MTSSSKIRPILAIATLAIILTYLLDYLGVIARLEAISYDQRMKFFRESAPLNSQIAIVLIDEASIQSMNSVVGRWPWPRSVYGDLLDFMQRGGARAVVFDLLLTENSAAWNGDDSTLDPHDKRLIEETARTAIAYHAAQILTELPDEGNRVRLNRSLSSDAIQRLTVSTSSLSITPQNSIQLPYEGLYQAAQGVGIVTIDPDKDGVYRRVRLVHNYNGQLFPSLTLVALPEYHGRVERKDDFLQIGNLTVPVLPDDSMLINMVGSYQPYSISGILSSIANIRSGDIEQMLISPDEFYGKIVFIGASAVGLEDIKATPLAPKTPAVMLHASAISNMLDGDMLVTTSESFKLYVSILLALFVTWGILRTNRILVRIAVPLILCSLYFVFSYFAFSLNYVLPIANPLIGTTTAWIISFSFVIFTEGKDKRRVRNMLSQYVSPAVLAEVVDRYEDQIRAEVGKRVHLSILFSDVRGFTSFSEKLEAEQVVEILNTHFRVMTDIIFKYHGTLDKFIGDAIMAFWGAPIKDDHHADHAVLSALEMLNGLNVVNATLQEKNYPAIRIGLGINTGDVVLGNIGSEKKLDYTIIGDNVNLGSRLEGLTAKYGCPVIISEYTRHLLTLDIPCAVVDLVRVKGKSIPIKIFWPICLPDDELIDEYRQLAQLINEGFACYTQRDWASAISMYEQIPDGLLKDTFIERCRNYQATPPPDDWDGIYTLMEK